jgi:hypothetical protein
MGSASYLLMTPSFAGIDFRTLRGSDRVGVYVGACGSEMHATWIKDIPTITGYEQTGCVQSMFANRLSWWFDFRGPSKCVDTGKWHWKAVACAAAEHLSTAIPSTVNKLSSGHHVQDVLSANNCHNSETGLRVNE